MARGIIRGPTTGDTGGIPPNPFKGFLDAFLQASRLKVERERIQATKDIAELKLEKEDAQIKNKRKAMIDFITQGNQKRSAQADAIRNEEKGVPDVLSGFLGVLDQSTFSQKQIRGLSTLDDETLKIMTNQEVAKQTKSTNVLQNIFKEKREAAQKRVEKQQEAFGKSQELTSAIKTAKQFGEQSQQVKEDFLKIREASAPKNILPGALTKKNVTEINQRILDGKEAILENQEIMDLYNPLFLQVSGKLLAFGQETADKFGRILGLFGIKVPTDFTAAKAAFVSAAGVRALKFKKLITGVSFKPSEEAKILQSTINPIGDSPAIFISKLEQMDRFTKVGLRADMLKSADPILIPNLKDIEDQLISEGIIKPREQFRINNKRLQDIENRMIEILKRRK